MQTYEVVYLVSGDDADNQGISDTATLKFDAEDLDALFDILQEGEEDGSIQPELETIAIDGDITIGYVLIYDADGNEVFRDEDYDENSDANSGEAFLDEDYDEDYDEE